MPVAIAKMFGSRMTSSGGEAGLLREQVVGPVGDRDLAVGGVGLALLVERHDDGRGAVLPAERGVLEEGLLALLERDRVHDGLALDAAQAGLDHRPLRRVDHHRDRADVGLGGEQPQEARHRRLGVEHRLVHVHVDQLGAGLDLLAGDLDGLLEPILEDQLRELPRAGDVRPLADVDEDVAGLGDRDRLEARSRVFGSISGGCRGGRPATASAIAFTWAGVVPQQPPAMFSNPSRAKPPRTWAIDSGVSS